MRKKKSQLEKKKKIKHYIEVLLNRTTAVYRFVLAAETSKPWSTVVIRHPFNIVPKRRKQDQSIATHIKPNTMVYFFLTQCFF